MAKKTMEVESDVEVSDDEGSRGKSPEKMWKAMMAMSKRLEELEKAKRDTDEMLTKQRLDANKMEVAMERKVAEVWTRLVRIERQVGLHPDSPKHKPKPKQKHAKQKQPLSSSSSSPSSDSSSPSVWVDLDEVTEKVNAIWSKVDKRLNEMIKCVEDFSTEKLAKAMRDMAAMSLEVKKMKNDVAALHEFVVKNAAHAPRTADPSRTGAKGSAKDKTTVERVAQALAKVRAPDVGMTPRLPSPPHTPAFMTQEWFSMSDVLTGLVEYVFKVVEWSHGAHARAIARCDAMEEKMNKTRESTKQGLTRFCGLFSEQREGAKRDLKAVLDSTHAEVRSSVAMATSQVMGPMERRLSALERSNATIFEALRLHSRHFQVILRQAIPHQARVLQSSSSSGEGTLEQPTLTGRRLPESSVESLGEQQPPSKRPKTGGGTSFDSVVPTATPENVIMAQLLADGF